MAYPCPTGVCTRLPYFSAPGYTYNGRPIGDSANDNARKVAERVSIVANWMPPSSSSSGSFMIVNPNTNKVLDVNGGNCDDGTNIHLWTRNGTPAQIFRFGENGSIINVGCNKALDVSYSNCDAGANIHLWQANGSGAQSFRVESDGTIASTYCNKAVDIDGRFSGDDGSNIMIWPKNSGWNQQWRIQYA